MTPLVPLPERGRRFVGRATVRWATPTRGGELRLDALARVPPGRRQRRRRRCRTRQRDGLGRAADDGPARRGGRARRDPDRDDVLLGERAQLGRAAHLDRRRSGRLDRGGQPVGQVDTGTGRPARLGDGFFAVYGEAGGGRVVSSRLSPRRPPADAAGRPWPVRPATSTCSATPTTPCSGWSSRTRWRVSRPGGGTAEIEYPGSVDAGARVEARGSAAIDRRRGWSRAAPCVARRGSDPR